MSVTFNIYVFNILVLFNETLLEVPMEISWEAIIVFDYLKKDVNPLNPLTYL